jgi:hypothetical protein
MAAAPKRGVGLAEQAGLHWTSVSRIENGKPADFDTVRKLAAALPLDPSELRRGLGRSHCPRQRRRQAWELIDVKGPGNPVFHQFRDQHGEGVQHIGFWTPDIRASVEHALAAGTRLVSVTTDTQGNTVVQLLSRADVKLSPRNSTY